jgi:mycothiol synthase
MTEPRKPCETTRFEPQLVMLRAHLNDLPAIELPPGYHLRPFHPGDETAWNTIIAESFVFPSRTYAFETEIWTNPSFRPERLFFITYQNRPVATAMASDWHIAAHRSDIGFVHMVGVLPAHRGKHLGFWVSVSVLHRFVAEGKRLAVLQTDDFRLPAIKTYLQLQFEPFLMHENHRHRWRHVFQAIGRDDLEVRFKSLLEGPIRRPEDL